VRLAHLDWRYTDGLYVRPAAAMHVGTTFVRSASSPDRGRPSWCFGFEAAAEREYPNGRFCRCTDVRLKEVDEAI
jgi:hypothetical protein